MKVAALLLLVGVLIGARTSAGGDPVAAARANSLWYRVEVRVRIRIDWPAIEDPSHPGEKVWEWRTTSWKAESNAAVILRRVGSGGDFTFQAAMTGDLINHDGQTRALIDKPRSPDAPRGYCVIHGYQRESPRAARRHVIATVDSPSIATYGLQVGGSFAARGGAEQRWESSYCDPRDLDPPADVPWYACNCATLSVSDTETDHFWTEHFRFPAGGFGSQVIHRGRTVTRTFDTDRQIQKVTYDVAFYRCPDQDLSKGCPV